jgi:hypothetical protein
VLGFVQIIADAAPFELKSILDVLRIPHDDTPK